MMGSVGQVIEALGGTGAVSAALGLPPSTVSSWRKRRSIPAQHWIGLVAIGEESGVSFETLALLHSREART